MKRLLTLFLAIVPLLSMAQDDLYFTSSKKEKEKRQQTTSASMAARTQTVVAPTIVDYNSSTRNEDEYNRRYVYGGDYQNAGGAYANDTARVDSVEPRYDMDDPELDYRFSRRIVRFHNPRLYALASPYYWDLYYGYGAWDYLYDPWDPWYYHYGWGYGWTWGPWDCWYGSIWGWHHPYAWSYWGWGPGWSTPVHYISYHRNTVPREFNSSRRYMAAGSRLRTNVMAGRTMGTRANALAGHTPVGTGRTTTVGRTAPAGRTTVGNGRTNVVTTRSNAQDIRSSRGTSYTDYTNARMGRSSSSAEGARVQDYTRTREGVNQRGTINRGSVNSTTRSYSNQNSSSRTTTYNNNNTQSRTQIQTPTRTQTQPRTQTYTPTTRSSSSMGGGSFGGGSRGGGGGFGGGGGGGRGGGGRR